MFPHVKNSQYLSLTVKMSRPNDAVTLTWETGPSKPIRVTTKLMNKVSRWLHQPPRLHPSRGSWLTFLLRKLLWHILGSVLTDNCDEWQTSWDLKHLLWKISKKNWNVCANDDIADDIVSGGAVVDEYWQVVLVNVTSSDCQDMTVTDCYKLELTHLPDISTSYTQSSC